MLLVLVWNIWNVRNDFLWNGVDASLLETQIKAQTWLTELKKWNAASPQISSAITHKWKFPDSGWIKCNFDAAWDERGSVGGFGIVVRNSVGGFMAAQVARDQGVRSALHAKAAAARAAALFSRK